MALPELPTNWLWPFTGKLLGVWRALNNGTLLTDVNGDPPNVPDLNAVAPLEMAYNAPQGRFDLSIASTALIPSVPVNDIAFVDIATGDDLTGTVGQQTLPFATLKAALTAVTILGPGAGNPMGVVVHPGVYSDLPILIPSWVTVSSLGGPGTVLIQASTPTAPLVTGSPFAAISGITLAGANGVGGKGVYMATSGGAFTVSFCTVRDCETLIQGTGSGTELLLQFCDAVRSAAEPVICGIEAVSGAIVSASGCSISGAPAQKITKGYCSIGSGSRILAGGPTGVLHADDGIYVDGGIVNINAGVVTLCQNGVRIGPTGGTVELAATAAVDNDNDILVESAAGSLITSALLHEKSPIIAAGATWFGDRYETTTGDHIMEGNSIVGAPLRPALAAFGGGGITADGLVALRNTNVEAGTWDDVTDIVTSTSGSTTALFPGVGVGNSFFLGSDVPLPGAYLDVVTAQSGGAVTPKYWNGGVWVAIPRWMTAESEAPYSPTGNALFAATGKQDLRFSAMPGDTAKAVNGIVKYWYLWEVTSALGTIPRVEAARLITSHSRYGKDGAELHYGDARPYGHLDVDMAKWKVTAASPPGTAIVSYTANIAITSPAAFQAGPTTRELAYAPPLPLDLDTSAPVELLLEWYPTTTSTGTLQLSLYYVRVPSGAILAGGLTGETLIALTPTPPGVIGQTTQLSYPMLLPAAVAGTDRLAMMLRRVGSDAFAGTAVVSKATLRYRRWR